MIIEIKYGIGYGQHQTEIDVEDDATEEDIQSHVEDEVMQRVDYSWERVDG